jgi:DNA-directed RNA polymerase sigma subunit (sigma70/sigma32)
LAYLAASFNLVLKTSFIPRLEDTAQVQTGLDYWATRTTNPLADPAHQQLAVANGRFVVSLAQQYQQPGCSQQELLDVAYWILIQQL